MALSKEVPIFHRQQIDILQFIEELGELTPISEFRGPKTPSNRQILQLILYFLSQGKSCDEAGSEVVLRLLLKHTTVPATKMKAFRTLKENVVSLYKEARFILL